MVTRARYSLTVPGPSYPWFCRALVKANHGHLVHPDGTRHPQQVVDAQPVTGGTLVTFEAEIPTDLLDRAATTIAQPEHLTPTPAERARGWGQTTAHAAQHADELTHAELLELVRADPPPPKHRPLGDLNGCAF